MIVELFNEFNICDLKKLRTRGYARAKVNRFIGTLQAGFGR